MLLSCLAVAFWIQIFTVNVSGLWLPGCWMLIGTLLILKSRCICLIVIHNWVIIKEKKLLLQNTPTLWIFALIKNFECQRVERLSACLVVENDAVAISRILKHKGTNIREIFSHETCLCYALYWENYFMHYIWNKLALFLGNFHPSFLTLGFRL